MSALVHFFGDLKHVTLFRKGPKSDAFVILGAHVISTQPNIAPPHSNPLWTDTEGVCYQRKKDQCAVSSHFQLTGSIWGVEKKGRKQTSFVFTKTRCCLLLCSRLWCHRHGSSSLWPLGLWFFNSFTPIRAMILLHCYTHTPAVFA